MTVSRKNYHGKEQEDGRIREKIQRKLFNTRALYSEQNKLICYIDTVVDDGISIGFRLRNTR